MDKDEIELMHILYQRIESLRTTNNILIFAAILNALGLIIISLSI